MQFVCFTSFLQLPHDCYHAGVGPGGGVTARLSSLGFPDNGTFALIGDADGIGFGTLMTFSAKA